MIQKLKKLINHMIPISRAHHIKNMKQLLTIVEAQQEYMKITRHDIHHVAALLGQHINQVPDIKESNNQDKNNRMYG